MANTKAGSCSKGLLMGDALSNKEVEARMNAGLANARRAPKGEAEPSKVKPRESQSKSRLR